METTENKPVSVGNWILSIILLAIPFLNIIMIIVWAVSGGTHPSKKTFAQAQLILIGICIVLGIVVALLMPAVFHHPLTMPTMPTSSAPTP